MQRGLSNRQIQLMAIGGAIGTGLFLGSGKSIQLAGPSILLVYLIIGGALFFVMRALGELLMYRPTTGSFAAFAEEFIGPWAGFITGWTYWFCWIATAIAEITAVGIYMQFWFPHLPQWIPALICVVVLLLINLATVKAFGEIEFWFALIKIIAILALIMVGLVLIFTGFTNAETHATFANLWQHGGVFPNGFHGFILSFQMAVFAFVGIELVGITAGEAEDPKKTLPKAINTIPLRILFFYVGALLIIMSIYPWDHVSAASSPFVRVFAMIGIPAAAGVVNFVVLTSAASSCNSGIFSTSRMVYALSVRKAAPARLRRVNARDVPAPALLASAVMLLIGVLLNYLIPNATQVFTLVTSIATICFIWVWSMIVIAHLRYRRLKPENAAVNRFRMPGAPVVNWILLAFFVFVLVLLGFAADTRTALFVTPVWFLLLAIAYGLVRRHRMRKERLTE